MKEAQFYAEYRDDGTIRCFLCAHECIIKPGSRGLCGVRENRHGTLVSLVYGRLIASHVDPIEKKPFYHFAPGSRSFSIATMGCNFRCRFCQNADISQPPRENGDIMGTFVEPEKVVAEAVRTNCRSMAYTYTEPTVFAEYALDVALLARSEGLRNVFVSNGYMTEKTLESLAPVLDGANVDLKSFRDDFYREWCGARLQPVLDTLMRMKKEGIWVEVTTLIIPGLNDDPYELEDIAGFIRDLGPETPWHVSRFHPTYHLTDRGPTPLETVHQARRIGLQAGLYYVYTGNIPGNDGEDTFCPSCGCRVMERFGFSCRPSNLRQGLCTRCGHLIHGVDLP